MVRRYARQPGDVLAAQERALKRILAHSRNSAIARDMGFDRADSLDEYMSRTKVTHYPDLKPYWERAAMVRSKSSAMKRSFISR